MTDIKNSASVTYQMLGKAKDATFELMDSVMTTRNASCLGEFSLSPLFRELHKKDDPMVKLVYS